MLTQTLFAVLVLLVAVQRTAELRISQRHELELVRLGAREHAPGQLIWMQLLHGLWFASMLLEVKLLGPVPLAWLSVSAVVVFLLGQALRYSAMRELGVRWCVRIMTLPGYRPVSGGIFRYLRHPNYLGVVLEIAALPLVHMAWRTALVFSVLNAVLLGFRIAAEERALSERGGYREAFAGRPRFWPKFARRGPA